MEKWISRHVTVRELCGNFRCVATWYVNTYIRRCYNWLCVLSGHIALAWLGPKETALTAKICAQRVAHAHKHLNLNLHKSACGGVRQSPIHRRSINLSSKGFKPLTKCIQAYIHTYIYIYINVYKLIWMKNKILHSFSDKLAHLASEWSVNCQ